MLKFDGFEFDPKSGKLKNLAQGTESHLRQKLVALLGYLHSHQQSVVSKQELLDNLWEHGQYREKSLAQSILELRKALGDSASEPRYIRTLSNQGYQWIAEETQSKSNSANNEFDLAPSGVSEKADGADFSVEDKPLPPKKRVTKPSLSKKALSNKPLLIFIYVLLSLLILFAFNVRDENPPPSFDQSTIKIIVLPFQNSTGTQVMNWVEYGLSEMLTYDLSLIESLKVIAPTQIKAPLNLKLTQAWQVDLMHKHQADMVLKGTVSFDKQEQVLSYQLTSADGKQKEKHIKRLDLAVAMPDVASEIFRAINPKSPVIDLGSYAYVPSAMHDFARGLQALQSDGYILAQHYFKASMQIDKNHIWSELYLAISRYQLGDWQVAESVFRKLIETYKDPAILESAHFWLALIHYRQGDWNNAQRQLDLSQGYYVPNQQDLVLSLRNQLKRRLTQGQKLEVALTEKNDAFSEPLLDVPLSFQTDTAYQASIHTFETLKQQLTVKGHKPALFQLLLQQSLSSEFAWVVRDNQVARAIDLITELKQPYDLAIAWLIRGRLSLINNPTKARIYLSQAQSIGTDLNALLLLEQIALYRLLLDISDAKLAGDKARMALLIKQIEMKEYFSQDQYKLIGQIQG
jgi:DNA-binding winged helix-turn-helix (wHTH) protein/TolB-like protein